MAIATLIKETFGSFTILETYVCLTLLLTCLSCKSKIRHFQWIAAISFLNVANIFLSHFLLIIKIPIALNSSIYVILHHTLWLVLLFANVRLPKPYKNIIITVFLTSAILNLLFFEGFHKFNYYTFIAGALIYLVAFILESFYQLQKEKLDFFQSNTYLILCAPVLFFIGFSFMFGFKSRSVTSAVVFGSVKLYAFISCFANIAYYTIINIYIYKERKLKK